MVLHHMANIKERGVAACEMVRGADGEGCVLNRHFESAEGNHFSAVRDMEVVEGCFAEFRRG